MSVKECNGIVNLGKERILLEKGLYTEGGSVFIGLQLGEMADFEVLTFY